MEDKFTITEKKATKEVLKIKPNIRTMKSDAQKYIDKYKISLVDIATMENRISGNKKKGIKINWPIAIIGTIFVLSTIVFTLTVFQKRQASLNVNIKREVVPSFLTYDKQEKILLTSRTKAREFNTILKNALTKEDVLIGDIVDLVIIDEGGIIRAESFFERLNIRLPSNISEFLSNKFMLGFHAERKNWPFLILKVNSYNHTFAGMMEWEKFMLDDLANLFSIPSNDLKKKFEDKIIKNYDARVSIGTDGKINLIYSFIDKETIIIASQKLTFEEIIKRLTLSQN